MSKILNWNNYKKKFQHFHLLLIALTHSVHPLSARGGTGGTTGWTSNQIFKKTEGGGGLTGPQLLEGIVGKGGGGLTFSRAGGCSFHIKNKLKSEIFNDKKKYKQKYFFLS